jgi:hypothetical protein
MAAAARPGRRRQLAVHQVLDKAPSSLYGLLALAAARQGRRCSPWPSSPTRKSSSLMKPCQIMGCTVRPAQGGGKARCEAASLSQNGYGGLAKVMGVAHHLEPKWLRTTETE